MINGNRYGCFSPRKGIRQGDPLLHCLFIISAKFSHNLLTEKNKTGGFKALRLVGMLN